MAITSKAKNAKKEDGRRTKSQAYTAAAASVTGRMLASDYSQTARQAPGQQADEESNQLKSKQASRRRAVYQVHLRSVSKSGDRHGRAEQRSWERPQPHASAWEVVQAGRPARQKHIAPQTERASCRLKRKFHYADFHWNFRAGKVGDKVGDKSSTLSGTYRELCRKVGVMEFRLHPAPALHGQSSLR